MDPVLNKFIGIPFVPAGDSLSGFNCWNLYRAIIKEMTGRDNLPSYADYYKDSNDKEGIELAVGVATCLEPSWRNICSLDVRPYDLVLLRIAGAPWHVGTYVGDKFMIHTRKGVASCMERIDSGVWRSRVIGFWRYE